MEKNQLSCKMGKKIDSAVRWEKKSTQLWDGKKSTQLWDGKKNQPSYEREKKINSAMRGKKNQLSCAWYLHRACYSIIRSLWVLYDRVCYTSHVLFRYWYLVFRLSSTGLFAFFFPLFLFFFSFRFSSSRPVCVRVFSCVSTWPDFFFDLLFRFFKKWSCRFAPTLWERE